MVAMFYPLIPTFSLREKVFSMDNISEPLFKQPALCAPERGTISSCTRIFKVRRTQYDGPSPRIQNRLHAP